LREKESKNVSTNEECRYLIVSAKKQFLVEVLKVIFFRLVLIKKKVGYEVGGLMFFFIIIIIIIVVVVVWGQNNKTENLTK